MKSIASALAFIAILLKTIAFAADVTADKALSAEKVARLLDELIAINDFYDFFGSVPWQTLSNANESIYPAVLDYFKRADNARAKAVALWALGTVNGARDAKLKAIDEVAAYLDEHPELKKDRGIALVATMMFGNPQDMDRSLARLSPFLWSEDDHIVDSAVSALTRLIDPKALAELDRWIAKRRELGKEDDTTLRQVIHYRDKLEAKIKAAKKE